ncbi:hypothetical protein Syun_020320 [Stephania yunnanensis]|uniref:Uncharacterized protein n=1 Tax=Stephania yunnanensis TaxID=152371 RepID=A0AAP0IEC5_9MAGN
MLLGRVRAAPTSLDCLETERPPSKQIKDDALSIYEITLQKLRLGSRRALRLAVAEANKGDAAPCSSASASPCSSTDQSVESFTQVMEEDS